MSKIDFRRMTREFLQGTPSDPEGSSSRRRPVISENLRRFQILSEMVRVGKIWIDSKTNEYVGIAGDGTEVAFGQVGDESEVERFLMAHPDHRGW